MSGINIPDKVKEIYRQELKIGKKVSWLSMVIPETDEPFINARGQGGLDEFVSQLPPADCRFGFCDVELENGSHKIACILWAPDNAKVKDKMIYASTANTVVAQLDGLGRHLHASAKGDLEVKKVQQFLKK